VRLAPTLLHAREQQAKLKMIAYYTGLAVNIAIGLQVLFGALTTGLAAAVPGRKAGLITSIFGGILTLLASYLARAPRSAPRTLRTSSATRTRRSSTAGGSLRYAESAMAQRE
jgi:hypothetical protein